MSMHTYEHPRASMTVDAVVFSGDKNSKCVLLIKRRNEPFKDMWALPGGFVDMNETFVQAAKRELHEETGLKTDKEFSFVGVFDQVDRDPRGRTISVAYYVQDNKFSSHSLKASDDAIELRWFNLNNLPELAFDHEVIIKAAEYQSLKDDANY